MTEANNRYVPPDLIRRALRTTLGLSLLFFLFYIGAHYVWDLAFPTPGDLLEIFFVAAGGVVLGIGFSRFWPLPPEPGFERIVRTLLLVIPSLGIGMAVQILLQGGRAERALYLIFALAAWLGSGLIIRHETD